jgi:hypothetical protein
MVIPPLAGLIGLWTCELESSNSKLLLVNLIVPAWSFCIVALIVTTGSPYRVEVRICFAVMVKAVFDGVFVFDAVQPVIATAITKTSPSANPTFSLFIVPIIYLSQLTFKNISNYCGYRFQRHTVMQAANVDLTVLICKKN